MRMLMHVEFPLEPFNTYVRQGTAGQKIRQVMDAVKPEAAYFTDHNGHRGGTLVVNMKDASELPSLAEPFFLIFSAKIEMKVAMTPEDLGKSNLDEMGKKWAASA